MLGQTNGTMSRLGELIGPSDDTGLGDRVDAKFGETGSRGGNVRLPIGVTMDEFKGGTMIVEDDAVVTGGVEICDTGLSTRRVSSSCSTRTHSPNPVPFGGLLVTAVVISVLERKVEECGCVGLTWMEWRQIKVP